MWSDLKKSTRWVIAGGGVCAVLGMCCLVSGGLATGAYFLGMKQAGSETTEEEDVVRERPEGSEEGAGGEEAASRAQGPWESVEMDVWDKRQDGGLRQWVMLTRVIEDWKVQMLVSANVPIQVSDEQQRMLEYVRKNPVSRRNALVARMLLGEPLQEEEVEAEERLEGTREGQYGSLVGMMHMFYRLDASKAADAYAAYAKRNRNARTLSDMVLALSLVKGEDMAYFQAKTLEVAGEALDLEKHLGHRRRALAKNYRAVALGAAATVYMNESEGQELGNEDGARALSGFAMAREIWANQGNGHGAAWCDMRSGQMLARDRKGDMALALAYYESAQKLWTMESNPTMWGRVETYRGDYYSDHRSQARGRDKRAAVQCYKNALTGLSKGKDMFAYAAVQQRMGRTVGKLDDFDTAENQRLIFSSFAKAQEIWTKEKKPYLWAEVNVDMGEATARTKNGNADTNLLNAAAFAEEAAKVFREIGATHEGALASGDAGFYYMRLSDKRSVRNATRALMAFTQARDMAEEGGETDLVAEFEVDRGVALIQLAGLPGQVRSKLLNQAWEALSKARRLGLEGEESKERLAKLITQVEEELDKR